VQDGQGYVNDEANPRTDRDFMPPMLDNLIHEKRIPSIVAVLIAPGPGNQRSTEYDTVSDRYTNFIETEVLPRITKDYQVAFTTDPEGRATFGMSSGAAAALTMAWLQPNLYHRVVSYSGTFVALQRNATAPNGAWDFHQTFIPNSERKPLRIWLHVSENDLGATSPAEGMRNWVIANNRMTEVLKAKRYPYQFVSPRPPATSTSVYNFRPCPKPLSGYGRVTDRPASKGSRASLQHASNDTSGLEHPQLLRRVSEHAAIDLLVVFANARCKPIKTRC
jgi:hypothetical protein